MKFNEFVGVFKQVFKNKRYVVGALISIIVFYCLEVFFSNYKNLMIISETHGFLQMAKAFPLFLISYGDFFTEKFLIGLIILSVLFGILFTLITYKTKMIKEFSKKGGALATVGIFLGIIAPGCSACGVGILSVLGISSATLSFLPFGGFELIIISILVMIYSVYKITYDINRGIVCEIPKKTKGLNNNIN